MFPDDGITKGDLFEYYGQVADTIVPHLKDRPFTLKRYPHGITQEAYFQKQAPKGIPEWIPTRQFRTQPREGGPRLVDFVLVNSREALLWMVQMNCVDMNAWYSRVDKPERPDYVVFDLDPPTTDAFANAIPVAHLVREALEELDLRSYVKTSGAVGDPRARADHAALRVRRDVRVRRARLAQGRGGEPGPRDDRVAEGEAAEGVGARRPPAERPRQDDRVGVLGAAEARRAGLDAAALGGADGRRASARLRDARGARRGSSSTATSYEPVLRGGQSLGPALRSLRKASVSAAS